MCRYPCCGRGDSFLRTHVKLARMPTYGRGRFPALFANYINGIALQGMRNNAMRPKEAWNAPYIRGELRSNGHGKVPPKFMKSCHGRPHLQCAHRLASLCRSAGGRKEHRLARQCRYAGVVHAPRNPCYTMSPETPASPPGPPASGRGSWNESLRDFHVNRRVPNISKTTRHCKKTQANQHLRCDLTNTVKQYQP